MSSRKRKLFGTDGVRGKFGTPPVTPDFFLKLGWAAGRIVSSSDRAAKKIVLGKDTRISSYALESALEAGVISAGVDVHRLGAMPTPGVAFLTQELGADAGIVISASHNPHEDNGLKLFSREGTKLSDEDEILIESELEKPMEVVASGQLGKAFRVKDADRLYSKFCKATVSLRFDLSRYRIVIDCANGAAYNIAPSIFREFGASVIEIGTAPNGLNINQNCGSTSPSNLVQVVRDNKADVGIALDGDGDRLIMVDHKGEIVDGDELLFIIAKHRLSLKLLSGGVVGTQMSNLGLERALNNIGLDFERSKVGDRYVLELMQKGGWTLGGESSGHIICKDLATTGDGLVAAIQVFGAMTSENLSLYELKKGVSKLPQIMLNVRINPGTDVASLPEVQETVFRAQELIGERGRVLIRASGTEPLIRIMVEGDSTEEVERIAKMLGKKIESIVKSSIAA
jgi:phosphoglucosamine mutase